MALGDPGTNPDQTSATPIALLGRGWIAIDGVSCDSTEPNRFYALENDATTTEIFVTANGHMLAAGPLPEPPYDCVPLSGPTFIEEIK